MVRSGTSQRCDTGTVRCVATATGFRVLGAHAAPGLPGCFDAFDLVVALDSGDEVVLGVRTDGYLSRRGAGVETWEGGYVPLPADVDLASVRHWDFGSILWVGPAVSPCVIWINADGCSLRGIRTLLTRPRVAELLAGPGGRGLPTPERLGIAVPADLERHGV